ncbi:MAG: pyridoxal-phosphate dependent enzyme [Hamadaea sp.]|nr:pyridoxal-phosphate dependent enzyme [Hamadaea sp.]NUR70875.1 pyridoxal-phosphate dependent enzyme [Hamadaea sp.]NUT20870.1 pyridoxal-phosphate dependent enzyme [Hamadaea sp.]
MWLDSLTPTPVSELLVTYAGKHHRMLVKHESYLASGSVKERTAIGLLWALDRQEPLTPGTVVVESTSGNLGIALAHQLARIGGRLIAVIDPKTPVATRHLLLAAGATLHMVDEDDGHGGYLLTRLATVRALIAAHPGYRWTNQYESDANPEIHARSTGPEILCQGGPELDAIYVAVSTGGTLAGIARHVRGTGRPIRLIAVDAYASMASGPPASRATTADARLLPGIGASRQSSFLTPQSFDARHLVRDSDAIAMCRMLRDDTDIGVGGSAGCVLNACVTDLTSADVPARPLCLAPDDAAKYEDSIYSDEWLEQVNLADDVEAAIDRWRADGLAFKSTEPQV